jgi:hypothetical protein
MSVERTPQEKKKLSLERDRRNVYGENAKSSRKNIPLGKQLGNRVSRHAADLPLGVVAGPFDEGVADLAESLAKDAEIARRSTRFRKRPDAALGDVLKRKQGKPGGSRNAFGTPPTFLNYY